MEGGCDVQQERFLAHVQHDGEDSAGRGADP